MELDLYNELSSVIQQEVTEIINSLDPDSTYDEEAETIYAENDPDDAMHGKLEAAITGIENALSEDTDIADIADALNYNLDDFIYNLCYYGHLDNKAYEIAEAHGYIEEE